ncbi:hypothetical protein GTO27_06545 [Candidatus Bathyarchaeota archaeon]|nr:hypothetical protein [Candidatus Bathyarchaeota archaeon]
MRKYLVVSLLIAIVIIPLMYSLYRIFCAAPFVEPHFSTENYAPFLQTWCGFTTIALWIVIGSSWVIIGFPPSDASEVHLQRVLSISGVFLADHLQLILL